MATEDTAKASFFVYRGNSLVLSTDDYMEAENAAWEMHDGWSDADTTNRPRIVGTHPTHEWINGRCRKCESWDNGSYGSHFPCGFAFDSALVSYIVQWRRDNGR